MSIPGVTQEYTPSSCRNLRKPMRLPPHQVIRPNSPALCAEQFPAPNQTCKEPWLLDGTPESPQEHPHKSRRTLMSPQKCEIARCSLNQLEMMPESPAFSPEQSPVPRHTRQVAWLPLCNSRDSLRHPSEVYRNTKFSTETRGKLHAPHIVSGRQLIPRILLKR